MVRVTAHAISRFRQRVADISEAEAHQAILSAIAKARAIDFGAPYVRLGTGERIVIEDGAVVTVLDKGTSIRALGLTAHAKRMARRLGVSNADPSIGNRWT